MVSFPLITSSTLPADHSRLFQKTPSGEVAHERADAEAPRWNSVTEFHPVDQGPEMPRANGHDVPNHMSKASTGAVAVLRRRECRPQEQHQPVGILVG